jgi:putative Mg2+ transporter-C (MgtC) family protein
MELREITYLAVALRIVAAALLGGLLGMERGMKNRPAGMRTYMLVCTGACLVMLTNQYIYQLFGTGDPVRMGAQVVSGIGFLGGGTIIVTRHSRIKGLTTAAGLWAAAGVGLALGIGFYEAAVVGAIAIFVVMTLLQRMDDRMHGKAKRMDVYVELIGSCTLGDFLLQMQKLELEVSNVQRESSAYREQESRAFTATLTGKKRFEHAKILEKVGTIEGVLFLEEL